MTNIKLVTFDLDDTLWAVSPVVIRANQLCWEWMQQHTPAFTERYRLEDLYEGSELRTQLLERYPEITHSMTLIRLRLLELGYKEVGYSEEEAKHWANKAFQLFHQYRHDVEPYDAVRDMLAALKDAGYLVGALSNGNAEISLTPLAEWFDFQYNADGVGTAKPHPLMFEKALAHAGVTSAEAVHIGDHPINDVKAAKELGFKTIWVNPEGLDYPHEIEADLIVEELSDLPRAIATL